METLNKRIFIERIKVVIATAIIGLCILGATLMWFSGSFFPVYVAGKMVIWRKIARLGLYVILAAIGIVCGYAIEVFLERINAYRRMRRDLQRELRMKEEERR